jgi:hypothetical protein
MEFIGHGALGWNHPPAWATYFAVVGIPEDIALSLMPWVGVLDVTLALTVLFFPMRAVVFYMAAWGLWTAMLRPLAGEPVWELIERAGNFGALVAWFLLAKGGSKASWFRFDLLDSLGVKRYATVSWILRLTTAALLLGHGALGLIVRKPLFSMQYGVIGLHAAWFEPLVGAFEMALALGVLVWPEFGLLVFILIWKLATEVLSPIAGTQIWVFIEHGGSYAAPLALALIALGHENPVTAVPNAAAA